MSENKAKYKASPTTGRKETAKLRSNGHGHSGWDTGQLNLDLEEVAQAPEYKELRSPKELGDPAKIYEQLQSVDWSFTDADTQYLSHDIHPYPAKFIPQIPGHLIARLSVPGDLVFDPFGGSGTTAVEALRLNRRCISVDANPVASLIGQVKTARLDSEAACELGDFLSHIESWIADRDSSPEELLANYSHYVPEIPNRSKWFPDTSASELALIRSEASELSSEVARDVARLALSRIVLKVSFQDSETRYASKPWDIPVNHTLKRYVDSLAEVATRVANHEAAIQYGSADFLTKDSRDLAAEDIPDQSVDLVITSPPYGNANDYHLYHRFRLFWLGFDPRDFGKIEIGSHLRHQRENTGFESFIEDLDACVSQCRRVLRDGRYAALVVGTSVYDGEEFRTAEALKELAEKNNLEYTGAIPRDLHQTKRSFVGAGQRAKQESIVLLRKPPREYQLRIHPPSYSLWDYEETLAFREAEAQFDAVKGEAGEGLWIAGNSYDFVEARKLTFASEVEATSSLKQASWQRILENGTLTEEAGRKNSKYATHGIHRYKGKFYPQLAKSILKQANLESGATVFDPFCGSGTALLEARLNGLRSYGCDLHPLAAKIAKAKVGVLDLDPVVARDLISHIQRRVEDPPAEIPENTDAFREDTQEEIFSWFPEPVVYKLNWLLNLIRTSSDGIAKDFLEVVFSSIIRKVSQQDPSDLRIRRRKPQIDDAPAIQKFGEALAQQSERLERYWSIRSYNPHQEFPATVVEGDARKATTYQSLGLGAESVDFILTSPPYATALPYIDTDRLSLLTLFGMTSSERRPLERGLTGSREILKSSRDTLEERFLNESPDLPETALQFISSLHSGVLEHDVGFRRRNKPALLFRFFTQMRDSLTQCYEALKEGGEAVLILGDNTTRLDGEELTIPTRQFTRDLAEYVGFEHVEDIPISVTTEDMKHTKNAITDNTAIWLRKSAS